MTDIWDNVRYSDVHYIIIYNLYVKHSKQYIGIRTNARSITIYYNMRTRRGLGSRVMYNLYNVILLSSVQYDDAYNIIALCIAHELVNNNTSTEIWLLSVRKSHMIRSFRWFITRSRIRQLDGNWKRRYALSRIRHRRPQSYIIIVLKCSIIHWRSSATAVYESGRLHNCLCKGHGQLTTSRVYESYAQEGCWPMSTATPSRPIA